MRHVFIPAALILAAVGAGQVTLQAQGMGGEGANVMLIDGTGRPGAVDVYVDGALVERQMLAGDRPGQLHLTPGTHQVTVKSSDAGTVLASTAVDVQAGRPYALSFQNDWRVIDYTLNVSSGDRAVWRAMNTN
ncbi:hypothetical protein DAERI_020146 [Deinococcus aerius]|uniref:DUF4397 domain-containing protein n=2 Tax=Deinococcus TaxID=1298 RepID=A0A2I9CSE1_9DEIO|nr:MULTISPECIES: DUF4397 domain-containing protein [Deinococcus]MBB5293992.1 hypothetical protein [Deinococcus metallilatus]QBY07442.1 hypothetical protein E5F05_05595 [Deinococcus metallilatus]RXJ14555.1 hypothetical protein ERJ73_02330 [Deinococcus metallilatus]TLK30675.1 DUF4397 domain-containing protein [Deinococcus metallilatus]GBF04549.1 hypothetical protein DAERI_020146 [Deinococcus aerius]